MTHRELVVQLSSTTWDHTHVVAVQLTEPWQSRASPCLASAPPTFRRPSRFDCFVVHGPRWPTQKASTPHRGPTPTPVVHPHRCPRQHPAMFSSPLSRLGFTVGAASRRSRRIAIGNTDPVDVSTAGSYAGGEAQTKHPGCRGHDEARQVPAVKGARCRRVVGRVLCD